MNRRQKAQIEDWIARLSEVLEEIDTLRDEVEQWQGAADESDEADEDESLSSDLEQIAVDLGRAYESGSEALRFLENWGEAGEAE
ncbi:MAG TPA: hypothetical protein VM491_16340 [Burkholderiaceae bacterium]|nr:hypothetical protein [Burkholderiaceae bacterium]